MSPHRTNTQIFFTASALSLVYPDSFLIILFLYAVLLKSSITNYFFMMKLLPLYSNTFAQPPSRKSYVKMESPSARINGRIRMSKNKGANHLSTHCIYICLSYLPQYKKHKSKAMSFTLVTWLTMKKSTKASASSNAPAYRLIRDYQNIIRVGS